MAFGSFKTLGEAIRTFQVTEAPEDFIHPEPFPVQEYFRTSLKARLACWPVNCSESAVCENLLYPVLQEVALAYADVLVVWSHIPIYRGDDLLGVPDYLIAKRSPLSKEVLETPLAMIMEAKKNDFDQGWAQCLAAMCAAQEMNGNSQRTIYGGVSDGFIWRFGKIQGSIFARNSQEYSLTHLDELLAALNHLLSLCKEQILSPAHAA